MRLLNLLAFFISSLVLFSIVYNFAIPHLAKFRPHWNSSWYDLGLYGASPTQSYFSFDLVSPRVEILRRDAQCDQRMTNFSSGAATNFAWQHHARWHPNNTITLFDNSAYDYYLRTAEYSPGMVIDLNLADMTARLRNTYFKLQQ